MPDDIPDEVLIEILKRLPLKFLGQLRCVCKSWHSLIANPYFVSAHTNYSIKKNRSHGQSLSLFIHRSEINSPVYYNQQFLRVDEDKKGNLKYEKFDVPNVFESNKYLDTVDSSNGLVCFSDYNHNRIYLWNPLTGNYFTIPPDYDFPSYRNMVSIGFGYDYNKNDYKVVRIVLSEAGNAILSIKIYELNLNTWRTVELAVNLPIGCMDSCSTNVNGIMHWIGFNYSKKKSIIAAFDLRDELFRELEFPNNKLKSSRLQVWGERLALIESDCERKTPGYYTDSCIWVMKEYGVVQSWCKKYVINSKGYLRVLGFHPNGGILKQSSLGELESHDPKSRRILNYFDECKRHAIHNVHFYNESLALLSKNS